MNKVKDLKPGDRIDQPLLVAGVHEGVTAAGSPYLSMTLQDATGSIESKLWDVQDAQKALCQGGKVIQVKADVLNYKGRSQLKVIGVAEASGELDPQDYRMSTPVDLASLKKTIQEAYGSLTDEPLRAVVKELLDNAGEDFYKRPAAVKNHHEFEGGLATHVTNMLKLGEAILPLYPVLDHDLLVAGIMVHDIGKLRELSGGIVPEYTLKGNLIGHISLGNAMIEAAAQKLGYADREEIILLEHMVLSHHGEYEFGSPELPKTPEAEMLHFIDNADARMEMLRKAMETAKEGEFTLRQPSLENRQFYKAHQRKKD